MLAAGASSAAWAAWGEAIAVATEKVADAVGGPAVATAGPFRRRPGGGGAEEASLEAERGVAHRELLHRDDEVDARSLLLRHPEKQK